MRYARLLAVFALGSVATAQTPPPFTLQQVLSAPFANQLNAAPIGNLFAWVEDAEGRHNLYVGGKDIPARSLTHNTEDDGQAITQLAWAPDASAIAYTYGAPTGADGKPANPAHLQHPTPVRVMLVNSTGDAAPTPIAEGRSPLFTTDGHALLFIHDGQIWTTCLQDCHPERSEGPASPAPAPPHQLVYDRGSASSLTLSPDGTLLAFISRRREVNEPSHSFLALYSLTTHTLSFPAPSTSDDSAPAFSPDGRQIAWIRDPFTDTPEFANPRVSPTPWSIQLLDIATNTTRTVYSPKPNKPGSVLPNMSTGAPPLFFVNGHRIVFASEATGWVQLYCVDPSARTAPYLLDRAGLEEVEDISLDHERLLFSSNFAGYDPLDRDRRHIMSYLLPDVEELGEEQGTSGVGIETSPTSASAQWAALVSDARTPMHPALIMPPLGAARASITPLRPNAAPEFYPAASLITPQQVLFDSFDGLHLHSQLFLPKREADSSAALRNDKGNRDGNGVTGETATVKKHAALIFVHGGPKRQMLLGYPGGEYYSNAYAMNQYLASRGFIVLSVNYRCGIGYGLEFRTCKHAGATGATEYNDVLAAQKYLASRPDVDPARIGIWGGSYGGYLTALALSRNSDLFAAGVDFHGVHDWNLEDNASDWKRGTFAQQDAIGAEALKSSPLADLSKWHSPILLIHGDNDPEVAYAQTPLLADALRARNASLPRAQQVDVQELIFPDELHEFVLHKDWLAAYTAAAAFFERTLKP